MSKFIIDMPEGWTMEDPCLNCPCVDRNCTFPRCPLANAKEAKEVRQDLAGYGYANGNDIYNEHGKPVKLWATEDK